MSMFTDDPQPLPRCQWRSSIHPFTQCILPASHTDDDSTVPGSRHRYESASTCHDSAVQGMHPQPTPRPSPEECSAARADDLRTSRTSRHMEIVRLLTEIRDRLPASPPKVADPAPAPDHASIRIFVAMLQDFLDGRRSEYAVHHVMNSLCSYLLRP